MSEITWDLRGMISSCQGSGSLPSLTNVRPSASACYNAIIVNPKATGWFRSRGKLALVEAREESSELVKRLIFNVLRINLHLNTGPRHTRQNHTFVRLGKAVKQAILRAYPFKQSCVTVLAVAAS